MKIISALILGAAALVAASLQGVLTARGHTAPHVSARVLAAGTVQTATRKGNELQLLLRVTPAQLTRLTVGSTRGIATRDGQALAASDVRPGDQILVPASGPVEDTSQVRATLNGIVSAAPGPSDDPMVVSIQQSRGILVDLSAQTVFGDPSGKFSSLAVIEDADEVRVTGVLDQAVGEMTQTISVLRLGP